jgi:two-component system, chemotaxis family, CheB/CheR fusion protein
MAKVDPNAPEIWEIEDELGAGRDGTVSPVSAESEALQSIFRLLQELRGVDFSRYRQTTVGRRVSRRMSLAKQSSLVAYAALLAQNPAELEQLHWDLLLSITEFFRDPDTFAMLKRLVFPTLVERRPHKSPIRVWVPGCATGEEVYSLAICFHEFMEEQQVKVPVQFFGTDISEKNIAVARTAHYPLKIQKQVSPERLERYFDESSDGYRVNKTIRERCVFAVQDLGRDPPFANVDLVSCRNVLIYFEEELQELATSLFYFSLSVAGYLLLGVSENLQSFGDLFAPADGVPNLLRKRVPSPGRTHSFLWGSRGRGVTTAARLRTAVEPRKAGDNGPETLADRAVLAEYGPPGVLVDSQLQIRQFRGRVAAYLEPASGSASLKLSKMIRAELMPDLFVALEEVKKTRASVKRTNVSFSVTPEIRSVVDIAVLPLSADSDETFYLVLFERGSSELSSPEDGGEPISFEAGAHNELFVLRRELQTVKHQLQGIIEEKDLANHELWTANEEIQSANEELQSVNEEMEAAKEELESANEELVTLNEELHRKNLALSESEGRFRGLVESSADWIWEADESGRLTYSSPRVATLLGFDASEVVGQSLRAFLPEVWTQIYQKANISADPVTNVFSTTRHKSGNAIVFDTSCVAMSGDGRTWRGVSRDVSERVVASERLKRSEESLALAQEIAKLGHWELDLHGGRNLWSTQMFRMLNVVEGTPPSFEEFLEIVHPEDRARVALQVEQAVQFGRATRHEWRSNPERGDMRVFEARSLPISDAAGGVHKLVGTLLDITDKRHAELAQKEAQEALRQARESLHHAEKMQAVGQLAGGVAHDFNNQLTTVLAFTELLREQVGDNTNLTAYCDQIMGGIKRASDLTAQLLAYSRKGKYQSVQVDLDDLVGEVSTLLRRTIDRKVDVRLQLGAATCSTLGDPTQLQNALLNLALNARDAMTEGGRLTIATRVVEGREIAPLGVLGTMTNERYVEVSVADTGVGMEPEVLTRIFEPFFSTKAPGKGLGMGLPSVYGAIAAHNGAIRVESAPQQGSTFFVYLPAVEFQASPEVAPPSTEAVVKLSARVMVVEDEPTLRTAVCTVLTHLGHRVSAFANGREAIEYYRVHWRETDVVILDMIMPVMNGKETFIALRAINPDVVALLASGYSLEGEAEEVLRSGVKGFLQKPFKMEDLAKGVTDALNGHFRPSRSPVLR